MRLEGEMHGRVVLNDLARRGEPRQRHAGGREGSTDNLSVTRLDHVEGPEMGGNWRLAFTNASAK